MARGDGIDRTCARNISIEDKDIKNIQSHNEREKDSYSNEDIVPERTWLNIHYKQPVGNYKEIFEKMCKEKTVSTRGLKPDAIHFNEMVLDVNTAYFHNHGGYEFAKRFYADAYKAVAEIVGGEQYILSAVMHADERHRTMSKALGKDVFHYHMHVVYIPVVEKKILWTKRCKDPEKIGTVKETIMQVSSSKKWSSAPVLDENGNPVYSQKGKMVLQKSYSVLQDDFFNYMCAAGYADLERGERGSDEEHLTVTQFKIMKDEEHLAELDKKVQQRQEEFSAIERKFEQIRQQEVDIEEIDRIEAKPQVFSSNKVTLDRDEYEKLATAAKKYVARESKEGMLSKLLEAAQDLNKKLQKIIEELSKRIKDLEKDLEYYNSVEYKIAQAKRKQENDRLHEDIEFYKKRITENKLWDFFRKDSSKHIGR